MARITVNTTGTQPTLLVSTTLIPTANANTWGNIANTLSVTCLQDITITNSTGVYSYTDFCNTDMNKLTTPADNEISVNMVIDSEVFFGNANATANSSTFYGISQLSIDKVPLQFKLVMNGGNATANAYYYAGQGFISQLAPTASPDAPVWITPMTLAVNGSMVTDNNP
jgi:hypothetical protein